MTVLPLRTPRNFPTVARDRLPGASGVSPMVICEPLTARTRPSVSRGARAGAAGDAAGGMLARVILAPSVAINQRTPPGGPLGVITYETTLEFPLSRRLHLHLNRQLTVVRPGRL